MATAVSSSTSSTASYVSSMVSGLDTDSLVEAAVAQKTARADTMEAKVEANEAKIAAYQELQGLVSDISDALSGLKSTTYSALGSGNAFDDKSASLSASDGSTATSYLSVDVESSAAAGEYDLTVVQLAKAMKIAGATADGTTALGLTGGFSIGVEGGEASTIAVTADMTLEDIADALADVSAKTGVNATLIKISSTEYRLVLTAADTDVAIVASVTDGDDVLSAIGLTGEEGAFANVIQDAQPAIITVDGVTVSRSTNELTDVIRGVSISLEAATEGQTITLAIEPDYAAVKTAVTDFITAYNALRAFISTQQTVESDGSVAEDAVLFADSVLRTLGKAVSGLITGSGDGDISGLSDLGITINASNQLVLSDETALNNAILSNADAFQAFFETQFATSNSALKLMTNDSTLSLDFTLEVTVGGDGAISDVTVDGVAGLFTVSGSRITGAKGTIYEGLTFALAAASSTSIDVSIQQGFADLMVNLMDAYGDSGSGLLQMRIDSLETIDTDLQTRADKIRSDGEAYRQVLINKYAAMEAEIQAAELLQQQIEAILGGGSDDD
ncbi:MAG: flagellar filament capping protein FliD [Caulobacter sp.]|nr:flagellar filament capping protein FliD [Caulobacter sp.]